MEMMMTGDTTEQRENPIVLIFVIWKLKTDYLLSPPLVPDEGKTRTVLSISYMILLAHHIPMVQIDVGKIRITIGTDMHACELNSIGDIDCLRVDIPPSKHKRLFLVLRFAVRNGIGNGMHHNTPGDLHILARDHNIGAPRQRPTDGIKRLAPHDDGLAHGHCFQPRKIFGELPRDLPLVPNHIILGCRCEKRENHRTTLAQNIIGYHNFSAGESHANDLRWFGGFLTCLSVKQGYSGIDDSFSRSNGGLCFRFTLGSPRGDGYP
jgi:hypothetical protein